MKVKMTSCVLYDRLNIVCVDCHPEHFGSIGQYMWRLKRRLDGRNQVIVHFV